MTTTNGFSKSENFQSTMSSLNYGHVMERAARDYQKEILEKEDFDKTLLVPAKSSDLRPAKADGKQKSELYQGKVKAWVYDMKEHTDQCIQRYLGPKQKHLFSFVINSRYVTC